MEPLFCPQLVDVAVALAVKLLELFTVALAELVQPVAVSVTITLYVFAERFVGFDTEAKPFKV